MTRFTRALRRLAVLQLFIVAFLGLNIATAEAGGYKNKMSATNDIIDVAVAADDFNTLAAALQAAGLIDTLKGEGPFTVFAPTDVPDYAAAIFEAY